MFKRKHSKFKVNDPVWIVNDRYNTLFQVCSVKQKGYVLMHCRTGIILYNIIKENKLLHAIVQGG